MRTTFCTILAAVLLGACCHPDYETLTHPDSTVVTDTLNVEDFHTIVADAYVDIHYTSEPGPAQVILTGPAGRLESLKPHVEKGVLFLTNHWMETASDLYYVDYPKCTVVAHSSTLKGIGKQEVALGNLNQLMKKRSHFDTVERYAFCNCTSYRNPVTGIYPPNTATAESFIYCYYEPVICMDVSIHKKGAKVTLDLTTDTLPGKEALKRIPVLYRDPKYGQRFYIDTGIGHNDFGEYVTETVEWIEELADADEE